MEKEPEKIEIIVETITSTWDKEPICFPVVAYYKRQRKPLQFPTQRDNIVPKERLEEKRRERRK